MPSFDRAKARLTAARHEVATCAILRRGRHLRAGDPRIERTSPKAMDNRGRAGLDPGHPAATATRCIRHAGGRRLLVERGWPRKSGT